MQVLLLKAFGSLIGGLLRIAPFLAAYFGGVKAANAKATREALKREKKIKKFKLANKKASNEKLLKKANKYKRDS